jgi:hypothetical protein
VICPIEASRNHGNSANGTNISSDRSNSQKPCGETLVTSTPEVFRPSAADFTDMLLDQPLGGSNLLLCQAMILRHGNGRLKPELRLAVRALNVYVNSGLLAREKVKPEAAVAKNGGTHWRSLSQNNGRHLMRL